MQPEQQAWVQIQARAHALDNSNFTEVVFRERAPLGLRLERSGGAALVHAVDENSIGQKHGISPGSCIAAINGRDVLAANDYQATMEALALAEWPLQVTFKNSPQKRGALMKRQRKSSVGKKGWKRRLVELGGGFLRYFSEPGGGLLKGQLSLAGCHLSLVPGAVGQSHCFQLHKDSEKHQRQQQQPLQYHRPGFGSPPSAAVPPPRPAENGSSSGSGSGSSSRGGSGSSSGSGKALSTDARVNAVLQRYQEQVAAESKRTRKPAGMPDDEDDEEDDEDVEEGGARGLPKRRPKGRPDLNRIEIVIRYRGDTRRMRAMNPSVHRSALAVIWQHEVKEALGMLGGLADMHLVPLALRRKKKVLPFQPSEHHGGLAVLACKLLTPGAQYEVQMEDRRSELFELLHEEDQLAIRSLFDAYDPSRSGVVSRQDCERHAVERTAKRRKLILEQYQVGVRRTAKVSVNVSSERDFLRLNPGNKASADATLARHEKKLLESEKQVLEVLRRADESNTRGIDWLEFSFVEAWWLNTNPVDVGF
eukprot:g636.t1